MEKIKIKWFCKTCNGGCYRSSDAKPDRCLYTRGYLENWQPTEDYEIVEKEEKPCKCKNDFVNTKSMINFFADQQTPNCAVCRWNELKEKAAGMRDVCAAQGYKFNQDVYNSPECQQLFESKND